MISSVDKIEELIYILDALDTIEHYDNDYYNSNDSLIQYRKQCQQEGRYILESIGVLHGRRARNKTKESI